MKLVIKVLLFSIFSLLIGCSGSNSSVQPSYPDWYLNTSKSNASYYYAVGEGSNKEEAKINALSQISSEISVSVSSTFAVTKTTSNNKYNKTVQQNTKSSVKEINFTGVKIVKNAQIDGKILTYLKVDRNILFAAQKNNVDNQVQKIESLSNRVKNNGIIELLLKKNKIEKSIMQVMSKLNILKAINNSFDIENYQNNLLNIRNNIEEMKSDANILVKGSSNTEAFKDIIKQNLSSLGLNLVNNASSKNLVIVDVNVNAKNKKVKTSDPRLRGAKFADVKITLTTLNADNKIIAKNIIRVLNISKESYIDAVNKTQKFERKIKKQGILNILIKQNR